jgi:hypothetical protein
MQASRYPRPRPIAGAARQMQAMRLRKANESAVRHARSAGFTACKATAEDAFAGLEKCSRYINAYLLGLLAMIKCSICSYQCDN